MKGLIAVFLLLSVAEGRHFWRHWRTPPGHSHCHPDHTVGPQVCPPGQVQTCSPPAQSQFPPAGPPPFLPPGFGPGNQAFPNWNQQTQFQQNGNPNSADIGKAEWVCRNSATGDMMIIVGINGAPSQTEQKPATETNINGNNHHGNPNDGNLNNCEHDHNVNTSPQPNSDESSGQLINHGEGLIDVRIGQVK
ncbi:uncharacterized protein LOC143357044 isoform X2 [Halictus rubicundus]